MEQAGNHNDYFSIDDIWTTLGDWDSRNWLTDQVVDVPCGTRTAAEVNAGLLGLAYMIYLYHI